MSLNLPWRSTRTPQDKPAIADATGRIICVPEDEATVAHILELAGQPDHSRDYAGSDGGPLPQEQPKGQFIAERADIKARARVPVNSGRRIKLPEVSLVMIETREHRLANLALAECVARIDFGDVLVFTDQPDKFNFYPAEKPWRHIAVPDWPEKLGWSRCQWQEVGPHLATSHALCIQWDSWVIDQSMWSNDFLDYDYIGAPWWYEDARNVGNGGFSLRSAALMRYLRKHRDRFPCTTALDDDLLCRNYRIQLQEEGFEWAPVDTAQRFAFECVRPDPTASHFGFHACFNFGLVLDDAALLERAKIMAASPYITKNGHMWSNFMQTNPHLAAALEAAE